MRSRTREVLMRSTCWNEGRGVAGIKRRIGGTRMRGGFATAASKSRAGTVSEGSCEDGGTRCDVLRSVIGTQERVAEKSRGKSSKSLRAWP